MPDDALDVNHMNVRPGDQQRIISHSYYCYTHTSYLYWYKLAILYVIVYIVIAINHLIKQQYNSYFAISDIYTKRTGQLGKEFHMM